MIYQSLLLFMDQPGVESMTFHFHIIEFSTIEPLALFVTKVFNRFFITVLEWFIFSSSPLYLVLRAPSPALMTCYFSWTSYILNLRHTWDSLLLSCWPSLRQGFLVGSLLQFTCGSFSSTELQVSGIFARISYQEG